MSADMNSHVPPERLWTRGFFGLIGSQFAGAFNDNLLKGALLVLCCAPAAGLAWTPQHNGFTRRTAAELYAEIRELADAA